VIKKSKKQDIELAVLLFLVGVLLFFYPMVNQVRSYQIDDEEYEEMALQFQPQDEDPIPVLPIKRPTVTPTPEPVIQVTPDTAANRVDTVETEEPAVDLSTTEPSQMKLPGTDMPAAVETPESNPPSTLAPSEAITPKAEQESTSKPSPVPTEAVAKEEHSPAPTKTPSKPTTAPMQTGIDLEACLSQNKDFVAWLTIPGTKINYPVVRSDNTEYYLHHLFSGKESKLGCLFSLKSSDYKAPSKNIAIYGHHISNSDAMFSTLMDYKSSSYYAAHSQIRVESLYGVRNYRIFAVLNMNVSEWDAATASFSSNDSFLRFVRRAIQESMYDTGVQVSAEDSILTLITCDRSYGGASGRLIVMAVQE